MTEYFRYLLEQNLPISGGYHFASKSQEAMERI
jgi:hypothetical protein